MPIFSVIPSMVRYGFSAMRENLSPGFFLSFFLSMNPIDNRPETICYSEFRFGQTCLNTTADHISGAGSHPFNVLSQVHRLLFHLANKGSIHRRLLRQKMVKSHKC